MQRAPPFFLFIKKYSDFLHIFRRAALTFNTQIFIIYPEANCRNLTERGNRRRGGERRRKPAAEAAFSRKKER